MKIANNYKNPLDKYPLGVYNICRQVKGANHMSEEKCECCKRTKHRSEEEHKRLLNRLSRIEGQIRGIKNMIEGDAYCTDIIIQVTAATAALNSFNKELLSEHIRTCVAEDIRNGKDEVIDDLLLTIQKLMK